MLKPILNHCTVPLVLAAMTILTLWGSSWVLRMPTPPATVIHPSQNSIVGIESGILFVLL